MPENNDQKMVTPKSELSRNPIADFWVNTAEETFFKSPLVTDSYRPPYNPDDIWQKKGDYSIYEKMCQDDQVSVCLQLKKDLVLGEGGHFECEKEDYEEIKDFLNSCFFETYEGDLFEDIEELLSSYDFGFSLTEKIFKIREEDSKLGLKKLLTRHPNSWRLYQNNKGAVTKFEQVTAEGDKDISPKALIHMVNGKRFQNPYGTSDLRNAYSAWFTKTQVIRYLGIFLEKAASATPVARYDKNAPKESVDDIFEALKKFQAKTALAIPKDIELEFLEAKNSGDAYIKAINLFNMFIGRSLFVPDLAGFSGSETSGGSLALGGQQMNIFFMHINRRRNNLENLINKEIVEPIVKYNFGLIKKYPKFKFKPLDDMKAVELAKIWLDAVKGKGYKPNPEEINHFRRLVKFPEGDVEFFQEATNPFNSGPLPSRNSSEESDNMDDNELLDIEDDESADEANDLLEKLSEFKKTYGGPGSGRKPEGGPSDDNKSESPISKGARASKASDNLSKAMKGEAEAKDKLIRLQKNPSFWNSPEYQKAAGDYKRAVRARQKAIREAKKVLQETKTFNLFHEESEDMDYEKKSRTKQDGVDEGEAQGAEEEEDAERKVFAKTYDIPSGNYHKKVNFKKIETKLNDYDQSVMDKSKVIIRKMLIDLNDQIEKKKIVQNQNIERIDTLSLKYKKELKQTLKDSFKELFVDAQSQAAQEINKSEFRKPIASDKFLEVIENEAFNFVGDYEYGILKKVRTELIAAIKDGKPLSQVLDVLDKDLNELSEVQIERFARTKHTEVMNNARVEFFESTGVVAAYQYSAILDDRTSEICSGLHGKIFVAGTEPIPPMHFNCRSVLIPITKYEEFKPTESIRGMDPQEFIEENKGAGFATK